jgi:hypothetical protein
LQLVPGGRAAVIKQSVANSKITHISNCLTMQYQACGSSSQKKKILLINLHTDKKNEILIYKEIQMGSVAKSNMRKGFLIFKEMRKYLVIYEEAISHI